MRLRKCLAFIVAVIVIAAASVAYATSEARVLPNNWGVERLMAYAIYQPNAGRIGTAYYRVVQSTYETRPAYELRYTGQGGSLSESSICIVDAVTLEPYRTTRKLKSAQEVFYVDSVYGDGRVLVRRKQGESGEVRETSQDFPGRIFDYEQLMWLVPQLDFSADDRVHFPLFSTIGDQTLLVVVRKMGEDTFEFHDVKHKCVRYDFTLNLVRQSIWVQTIDGVPTTVRYDTGDTIFYNLDLLKAVAAAKPAPANAKPAEAKKEDPKPSENTDNEKEGDDGGEKPPVIPF